MPRYGVPGAVDRETSIAKPCIVLAAIVRYGCMAFTARARAICSACVSQANR